MADSDDDMPPLEYVGSTESNPGPASNDIDDDMPPLEYVGTDASLGISFREGDNVILKGLSNAALNGQTGTLQSFQKASKGRLPVKLDGSGSMLAVKPENMEKLKACTQATKATISDFGVASAKATSAEKNRSKAAEDDEELPPLEYVGTGAPDRPNGQDEIRPSKTTESDDDMPPLEYVGSTESNPGPASNDIDDDMPPLEYVGTDASLGISFREGDNVILKGLSNAALNGQTGTLQSFQKASKGRLPVKLDGSGSMLAVKPENMEKLKACTQATKATISDFGVASAKATSAEKNRSKAAEDDDELPPLEYVGTGAPDRPNGQDEIRPSNKAESDDDMPPLEYVGSTESNPGPASNDIDDDMPPLEYVGTDASLGISFREGDNVILKGLSNAALNGQTGTLQSFQKASKGRLPVKLDGSGSMLAVKPENMEKLKGCTQATKATISDFGIASAKATSAEKNRSKAAEDDEELPPLEYVGTGAPDRPNGQDGIRPSNKAESDDDMPPLEYVGSTESNPGPASNDIDDDMPPLEYVGTDASLDISFREGDNVILKGLSNAALNGQTGTLQSFQKASKGRLPVKLDGSGSMLAVKPDNMEKLKACTQATKATISDFGVASAKATSAEKNCSKAAEDDEELPPLEYVGTGAPDRPNGQDEIRPSNKAESDDDMPPLEYVGSTQSNPGPASNDIDDDMPPLEYVGTDASLGISFREGDNVILKGLSNAALNGQTGTLQSFQKASKGRLPVKLDGSGSMLAVKPENMEKLKAFTQATKATISDFGVASAKATSAEKNRSKAAEDDEELPPLEYVGTGAPDRPNGQDEIRPSNKAESDDDMPPLEYVGSTESNPGPASNDIDDDMPPLEYVGTDASLGISFREGDNVILKGLSNAALNGQTGTLQSFQKASKGRLPVKLDGSGSMLAVKPENMEKLKACTQATKATISDFGVASAKATSAEKNRSKAAEDDDELPPLEYVGTGAPDRPNGQDGGSKDYNLPSRECFGSSQSRHGRFGMANGTGAKSVKEDQQSANSNAKSTFQEGDQVLIKCTSSELDGQQGFVESVKDGTFQVRLRKTRRDQKEAMVVPVAEENLHKMWLRGSGAGAMPPLQFIGQALPATNAILRVSFSL